MSYTLVIRQALASDLLVLACAPIYKDCIQRCVYISRVFIAMSVVHTCTWITMTYSAIITRQYVFIIISTINWCGYEVLTAIFFLRQEMWLFFIRSVLCSAFAVLGSEGTLVILKPLRLLRYVCSFVA